MAKQPQQKPAEGIQFLRYFGPLLDALRELGGSGTPDEVVLRIAEDLKLSDDAQNELLPSGGPRYQNQVAWARFYLVREGLLDSSRRSVWSLTERGRSTTLTYQLAHEIFLKWVRVFQDKRRTKASKAEPPEEIVAEANGTANDYRTVVTDVLIKLPAAGFERLCQRVLPRSGVHAGGGNRAQRRRGYRRVRHTFCESARLVQVLFQCKRFSKSVSPSHVRDFRGGMAGRADKGIILTTGAFTAEARREASRDDVPPIKLIDGEKLIDMLEQLELGLRPIKTYEVDHVFFKEFGG